MKNIHDPNESLDFSLVLGGPLFQLLLRLGLTTPDLGLLKKRIICITLFAWLPLFFLSLIEGKKGIPFLLDLESQSRFLVALPLLIAAELSIHKQMRLMVDQFIERDIITGKVLPAFKEVIASAMKMRNSVVAEVILLFLAFAGGHYIWHTVSVLDAGSWYAVQDSTGVHPTLAGYWYIFISRPLFQFILYRWYFRIFIWAWFLWKTSRMKLDLIPAHPDEGCGLGFLALSSVLFAPLIVAHGVLFSGIIANAIFYTGAALPAFMMLILSAIFFVLAIVLGPLFVFAPPLLHAKRIAIRDYGILASKYVGEFDLKWIRGGASDTEQLVGTSDLQSLADLANSFQVIQNIRLTPFDKYTVIQVIFLVLIPMLPLVLTMFSPEDLIKRFLEVLF